MITYAPYNSIAYPSSRWSKSSFSYGFSAPFPHPNFTGKETDCETGFSYFGARYYDPTLLTGWTAVDPMADKYPSLSPYNYCAWNPIKLVDPDGCKFDTTGMTNEQQASWNAAIDELCKDRKCKARFNRLAKSPIKYKVICNDEINTHFQTTRTTKGNILFWNPTMALEVDNGVILSPALVLDHEFGHMEEADKVFRQYLVVTNLYEKTSSRYYDYEENRKKYNEEKNKYDKLYQNWTTNLDTYDSEYKTLEEKRNIQNVEWITARSFGLIGNGQATRTHHRGKVVTVKSSISTEIINR